MSLSDSDSPLSSVPSSGDEGEDQSSPEIPVKKISKKKQQQQQKKQQQQQQQQQARKSSTPPPPRKPRRKEQPHVATLSDAPELAFIVMFRSRFADAFKGVPNLGCQDIERGVVDSTPSEQVEVLLCRLLGLVLNRKKPVERGHYQRPLEEAVHAHVTQWPRSWDGKSPFAGGRHFSALDAPQRLSVLKALINWALTSSEIIRALVAESYKSSRHEDDLNIPISVQPWGRDGDKRRYWLIEGREDTPFRLYRESNPALKTVSWINVAGTIDEVRAVAQELEDEDGSKHALALKEKILSAIPRFEEGEIRRKKREYRQSRKAFFKQPNGTSLYEGRTRGKRIKYTFSSDDEDTPASANNTKPGSETEDHQPRFTASGRQIRKPAMGAYGELKINGSNGTATGDATPHAGSEHSYGGDATQDWDHESASEDYSDEEDEWPLQEEEEEGAPKKSLRIILRVNKSRLPESTPPPAKSGADEEVKANGYAGGGAEEANGVHMQQRTEIDVLPDAPEVQVNGKG